MPKELPSWFVRFPVRVLLLLVLLTGAGVLLAFSRSDDPRFYLFLNSGPGHLLARVFGWHRHIGPELVPERPEEEWTAEERALRYRWERDLAEEWPLHRVCLTNDLCFDGRLLADYPAGITFQEAAGGGGLTQHIPRERVKRVDTLPRPAYRVSYRDVAFRTALPEFRFVKRNPFTVASDSPESEIRAPLDILRASYTEWSTIFASLAARPPVRTDLQVVFCGRQRTFQAFRERYASESPTAVGFYVLWLDRLFVRNFESDDHLREMESRIADLEAQNRANHLRPEWGEAEWSAWRRRLLDRIRANAREETFSTIRHEGAHQFFYTTGVHSSFRAENEWLIEGLALWCETASPGEPQADRMRTVVAAVDAGKAPSLETLVNARTFATLPGSPDLHYALSWTLVDWLMQPPQREAFFRYVRWQRDPANVKAVSTETGWSILQRSTGLDAKIVESGWAEHLDTLAVRTSTR